MKGEKKPNIVESEGVLTLLEWLLFIEFFNKQLILRLSSSENSQNKDLTACLKQFFLFQKGSMFKFRNYSDFTLLIGFISRRYSVIETNRVIEILSEANILTWAYFLQRSVQRSQQSSPEDTSWVYKLMSLIDSNSFHVAFLYTPCGCVALLWVVPQSKIMHIRGMSEGHWRPWLEISSS